MFRHTRKQAQQAVAQRPAMRGHVAGRPAIIAIANVIGNCDAKREVPDE